MHIFGATGSGKTSGSGKLFAKSFLSAGYGGLVLTAKPTDTKDWLEYAATTGRSDDVVVFNPQNHTGFNFLEYEASRTGQGAGITENLVTLFTTVVEVAERGNKADGEAFWMRSLKHLLRNAVDLLLLSGEGLSLPKLYKLIQSAPNSPQELNSRQWQDSSYACECLEKAYTKSYLNADMELVEYYFCQEFPNLAEKTRSIIVSMFTNVAGIFLRGSLKQMFCTETTISPDDIFGGKVVILDLPVKEWGELGLYTQLIFKYCFQQAVERRNIKISGRPVFIWADEAQNFITSQDQNFLTTARSSRAATVYLTQNIPNYYAVLGMNSKSVVDSLLGNFQTKIFHQNSDTQTNDYASKLIGQRTTYKFSTNQSAANQKNREGTSSMGTQESLEYVKKPHEFNYLAKGGLDSDCIVEGIIFSGGRKWSNGEIYKQVQFSQNV